MVLYMDCHFLVSDGVFIITISDLYDLFNLDTLDISLMRALHYKSVQTSFFNILNICV
jgi:hypothetical protein